MLSILLIWFLLLYVTVVGTISFVHYRNVNKKINKLHERGLTDVYQEFKTSDYCAKKIESLSGASSISSGHLYLKSYDVDGVGSIEFDDDSNVYYNADRSLKIGESDTFIKINTGAIDINTTKLVLKNNNTTIATLNDDLKLYNNVLSGVDGVITSKTSWGGGTMAADSDFVLCNKTSSTVDETGLLVRFVVSYATSTSRGIIEFRCGRDYFLQLVYSDASSVFDSINIRENTSENNYYIYLHTNASSTTFTRFDIYTINDETPVWTMYETSPFSDYDVETNFAAVLYSFNLNEDSTSEFSNVLFPLLHVVSPISAIVRYIDESGDSITYGASKSDGFELITAYEKLSPTTSISGPQTQLDDNSASNRIRYTGDRDRWFFIKGSTVSQSSSLGTYVAIVKNGTTMLCYDLHIHGTRSETIECMVQLSTDDYVEIWGATGNNANATTIYMLELSVVALS